MGARGEQVEREIALGKRPRLDSRGREEVGAHVPIQISLWFVAVTFSLDHNPIHFCRRLSKEYGPPVDCFYRSYDSPSHR